MDPHSEFYPTPATDLLLIFVKHPEPGKVKTRLAASIGHVKAVEIYQELLSYTLKITQPLPVSKVVYYGNTIPSQDLWSEAGLTRKLQEGEDLGVRMEEAFSWGFSHGFQRIVIIGSDCAKLTTEILGKAFTTLSSQQAVIGPAEDGGYYLLGMNTLVSGIFSDKHWSTDTVFAATIRDLELADATYSLLPTLSDIDTLEDIPGTFLEEFLVEEG